MTTSILQGQNLSVGFQSSPVLAGVDLTIAGGEIVVLAGPNGAGKSTLVKVFARQLRPLSGSVSLEGHDVWQLPPAQFAARVAYVPQSLEPPQDMTVEELVALGRYPHQHWWQWYSSSEDESALEGALAATEMGSLRRKYISQLSGGERQRAFIATALAQQPRFIILDEPTAHLDFRHQLELVSLIKTLREGGLGFLIVLHDLNLIARVADSVALIKVKEPGPNEIAASGAPDAVLTREHLNAVFEVDVHTTVDPLTGATFFIPVPLQRNSEV